MKSIVVGVVTVVVGYILLLVFSGVIGNKIHMEEIGQGISACICAILFLTGVASSWGYVILKEIQKLTVQNNKNNIK